MLTGFLEQVSVCVLHVHLPCVSSVGVRMSSSRATVVAHLFLPLLQLCVPWISSELFQCLSVPATGVMSSLEGLHQIAPAFFNSVCMHHINRAVQFDVASGGMYLCSSYRPGAVCPSGPVLQVLLPTAWRTWSHVCCCRWSVAHMMCRS